MSTLSEFIGLAEHFFVTVPAYDPGQLRSKRVSDERLAAMLYCYIKYLERDDVWTHESFYDGSKYLATIFEVHHKKDVMPLLFMAFTGKTQGLPLFHSLEILGKSRARARLNHAIMLLGGISSKRSAQLDQVCKSETPQELLGSLFLEK